MLVLSHALVPCQGGLPTEKLEHFYGSTSSSAVPPRMERTCHLPLLLASQPIDVVVHGVDAFGLGSL